MFDFEKALCDVRRKHAALISLKNEPSWTNGVWTRYKNPVLTADHAPLFWRYDLNPETNPLLLERFGINGAFNAGAIKWQGKYTLVVRVEGNDRKSFFAVAQSDSPVDGFRFTGKPIVIPAHAGSSYTNVYDMRHLLCRGARPRGCTR